MSQTTPRPSTVLLVFVACICYQAFSLPQNEHLGWFYPEPQPPIPPGWTAADSTVDGNTEQRIPVVFAIKQRHLERVEHALRRVSDPSSPEYGQHWSLERMIRVIDCQPSTETVLSWLRASSNDIQADPTKGGELIRATLPQSVAQRLFNITLVSFCHPDQQCRLGTTEQYSLPIHLKDHIEFVSGLRLPIVRRPTRSARAHAQAAALRSEPAAIPGQPVITNLEARDRAFQVHVNMLVTEGLLTEHCGSHGFTNTSARLCDDGSNVISHYESVLTPTHNGEDYLRSVNVTTRFRDHVCTTTNQTLTCLIVLGPDVLLVNYLATKVKIRLGFVDGSHSEWGMAPSFGFPTKGMTVNDVRKLYSMPQAYTDPAPQLNSQAVANFLGISIDDKDTIEFQRLMGSRQQPPVSYRGPNNSSALEDVEGSIDAQWIQGMGRGVPTTYHVTTGGQPGHEAILDWLIDLSNDTQPSYVQSLSYGENEDAYSLAYQQRGNDEFMKLGLRGVSVLVATGDTGIQGAAQAGGAPPKCEPFQPIWPASSPYVTAVGGTQFSTHSTAVCDVAEVFSYGSKSGMAFSCPDDDIGEIACSADTGAMITTGGGFSNRYSRPWYQDEHVREYLAWGPAFIPPQRLFNVSGRAYPDIAAVSQNVPAVFQGELVMVGGTSAAAPIAAGLVASLNGAKLALGKPPLGFLNPLLYYLEKRAPETYIDVRVGNNSGGNRLTDQYTSCEYGFPALAGWDAATGLGSLNFDLLYGFVTNGSRPLMLR